MASIMREVWWRVPRWCLPTNLHGVWVLLASSDGTVRKNHKKKSEVVRPSASPPAPPPALVEPLEEPGEERPHSLNEEVPVSNIDDYLDEDSVSISETSEHSDSKDR